MHRKGAEECHKFLTLIFFSPTTMMVVVEPQITAVQGEVLYSVALCRCELMNGRRSLRYIDRQSLHSVT